MGSDAKLLMNIAMKQRIIDGTVSESQYEYDLLTRYWLDINDV